MVVKCILDIPIRITTLVRDWLPFSFGFSHHSCALFGTTNVGLIHLILQAGWTRFLSLEFVVC